MLASCRCPVAKEACAGSFARPYPSAAAGTLPRVYCPPTTCMKAASQRVCRESGRLSCWRLGRSSLLSLAAMTRAP
eukprot:6213752-Pleurochrysis_carterae.AAC.5